LSSNADGYLDTLAPTGVPVGTGRGRSVTLKKRLVNELVEEALCIARAHHVTLLCESLSDGSNGRVSCFAYSTQR
jgi:hypothetical protein